MWFAKLILISTIGLVASRPSSQNAEAEPQVEVERQIIHEVVPLSNNQGPGSHHLTQRKIEDHTRDILEKIAAVNRKQGLTQKKPKPNYFHFPFSYSRSQNQKERANTFKFSRDPYSNPILEYLEKDKLNNKESADIPSFRRPNSDSHQQQNEYDFSMTDTNPEIEPEDNVPGQYIKRKITHYQSFMMPNPYMLNMYKMDPSYMPVPPSVNAASQHNSQMSSDLLTRSSYGIPNQQNGYPIYPYLEPIIPDIPKKADKNRTSSEKETINNIKDIISGSQTFQGPILPSYNHQGSQMSQYNPYFQNINLVKQDYPTAPAYPGMPVIPPNPFVVNNPNRQYFYNVGANSQQSNKARQNWNWPGANLFPIYIRDPFLQMYYAVTNMIEYGPNSGNEGPCKLTARPQGTRVKDNSKATPVLKNGEYQVEYEINKREESDEIKMADTSGSDLTDDVRYLDVEDIDVGDDDLVKFTINIPKPTPSEGRELNELIKPEKKGWGEFAKIRNDTILSHLASGKLDFTSHSVAVTKQTPVITEQILQVEELDDDLESEKAEDISISNEGSRKVFSKDNTGNGIFIQKLKVRKGGVAIAGPGGIATAGSGGTAIVGPNGIAYTHPDGLAIAGSGTKVIAVDPKIDLNDVIKDSLLNGTRHVPNTRLGKVVAVGPVIYYNRG